MDVSRLEAFARTADVVKGRAAEAFDAEEPARFLSPPAVRCLLSRRLPTGPLYRFGRYPMAGVGDGYTARTSTTPGTALMAPAICGLIL
jgi:hypothetical protein